MDELLAATNEVDKVLGEIGEISYELLHEKREEELVLGATIINKHLQVLNETLVNYFGKGTSGKVVLSLQHHIKSILQVKRTHHIACLKVH
jgi:hypothetical protein